MATSGRELSDIERQRIHRLRQAGLSVREVAKAERVSVATVQKIIKRDPSRTV